MVRLSYVNGLGEEIILDDDRHSFFGELMGREGFEAPPVKLNTVKFGNGNEDIVSAAFDKRELTCYFHVETMNLTDFERRFRALKSALVQVGQRGKNGWGYLRILRSDWVYARINCVYSEGLDSMTYDSRVMRQFSLTFTASDPYFYDEDETVQTMTTYKPWPWLHFGFHFRDPLVCSPAVSASDNSRADHGGTFFRSSGIETAETIELQCSRAFPVITIEGPAENIRLVNELTGKTIEFLPKVALLKGESLVINTKPLERSAFWTRYDSSVVNCLQYLTENSTLDWYLGNGGNVVLFRNSVVSPLGVCTMRYQQGWTSV